MDLGAKAREVLGVGGHQVGVDHREHLWQHLQHSDLAAERGEHGGELHPDHAAADHGQPPGRLLKLQNLVRIDGQVGARKWNPCHRRTGGDDDVLAVQLVAAHVDHAFAGQAR